MKTSRGCELIINADDFGMNAEVNASILKAINAGLATTTTMLVNLSGFDDACNISEKYDIKRRIGLHVNLTEGVPLTDEMKRCRMFCDSEGRYVFKKNEKRIWWLDSECQKAVYGELEAQIRRCRGAGIEISHADSHNHMHEEPGLILLFIEVLKKHNIPYLRKVKNMSYHSTFARRGYRYVCNGFIDSYNGNGVDYFGSIDEYLNARSKRLLRNGSVVELMVHPGKNISGDIMDVCTGQNLSEVVPEELKLEKKIIYDDLRMKSA